MPKQKKNLKSGEAKIRPLLTMKKHGALENKKIKGGK